jgi:mRNA interferase MazF
MPEEYIKDFDRWHESKKLIHKRLPNIVCSEREVRWCFLGVNIGVEEDGKKEFFVRPVLIVKKINSRCSWILPLSSSIQNNPYRYTLLQEKTQVVLSQIRTIDNRRLERKMFTISEIEFLEIIEKLKAIISIKIETPLEPSTVERGISEAEATVLEV